MTVFAATGARTSGRRGPGRDPLSWVRAALASPVAWSLFFVVLIVLTRTGSLTTEVVDWDESTFILIASDILRGNLPYLPLWDNKPPLLFFMLAEAMGLFGESLVTVRAFGAACLLMASLVTFQVCLLKNDVPASGAAVAVMIAVAVICQPTMTELLVIALLMFSVWLVLGWRQSLWAAFFAGVFVSLATLTRTNIGYCAVALGLCYALEFARGPARPQLLALLAYVMGGLLPLLAMVVIYWNAGDLYVFLLSAFLVPLEYAHGDASMGQAALKHLARWGEAITAAPLLFGSFTLLFALGLLAFFRRALIEQRTQARTGLPSSLILLLLAGSVLASILNGGSYRHYWVQFLPFAAIFISYAVSRRNAVGLVANTLAALTVIAALVGFAPNSIKVIREWPRFENRHVVRQMADAIAADREPSDEVYAFVGHLVHWYLGENPPSRIAQPSNLPEKSMLRLLAEGGYIEADEFGRILKSRPRYIITTPTKVRSLDETQNRALAKVLSEDYELWEKSGKVAIYKLRRTDR